MREYTYNPEEGEFVDFATLDDWAARTSEAQADIAKHLEEIERLQAQLADLERELANAQALKRCAYNAGYHQAECGLPAHRDIDKVATDALSDLVKRMCETVQAQLAEANAEIDRVHNYYNP